MKQLLVTFLLFRHVKICVPLNEEFNKKSVSSTTEHQESVLMLVPWKKLETPTRS